MPKTKCLKLKCIVMEIKINVLLAIILSARMPELNSNARTFSHYLPPPALIMEGAENEKATMIAHEKFGIFNERLN